ncbi:MAG: cell division-like protein [Propionibacteriales bacterium]|nr:cell division-like protein [Propionibacteriales bacterium]
MRVMLTVVDPERDALCDVVLDSDPEVTVGQAAPKLEALFEQAAPAQASAASSGTVVDLHSTLAARGGVSGNGGTKPMFVNGERLDPMQQLVDSPIREGVVVSLGDPRGCPPPEPEGLVEIRVVGGPGAGDVHRLGIGSFAIGSDPNAAIRLADAHLPPTAAYVDVAPSGDVTLRPAPQAIGLHGLYRPADEESGPVVVPTETGEADKTHVLDPGTEPALIELDRKPLDQTDRWLPGGVVTVGTVLMSLAPVQPPDASLSSSPEGVTLDFNRPPRLLPPKRQTEFKLPRKPDKPSRQAFPLMMLIIPPVGAVLIATIFQRWFFLIFGLMGPLMYMSNYFNNKKQGKHRYRDDMKKWVERTKAVERDARRALWIERAARRRDLPDPAALLLLATGPRARLWERRPSDPDWLEVRIGSGDLPSEVELDDSSREDHQRKVEWSAPDVPASILLPNTGVVGLAGAGDFARQIGGWMLAQLAALHSPADLRLSVLCPPDAEPHWNWVRWLPHSRGEDDAAYVSSIGSDDETTMKRIAELSRLVETRAKASGNPLTGRPAGPVGEQVVVLMDGARRLRLLPGVVSLLKEGPAVGVYFICLDADERQLPDEAMAVVTSHGPWLRLRRMSEKTVDGLRPDLVSIAWCERLARSLSPIRDVSGDDAGLALPGSSRLLNVLSLDPPDPERLAQIWTRGGRTTQAVLGEGAEGPFAIDMVRDGPHGLLAGTTGAGKSELLQTIIASLAVGNRPDEMTFVLVDYKGGAAFKDCNHLPHTVGMVTDLDGHLTTRALQSLAAELHRREHQLKQANAKDIEDYLAGMGPGDEPMPRLLIVIDEFAAMVTELPDFVTGIVDIARRGRSLGVHLILATQRPAGVVTADIKANTNLRIALRVTDVEDSKDVIEAPDSAYIGKSTPGRAFARLGHTSLIPFQTARVGGKPPGVVDAAINVKPLRWSDLARPVQLGGGQAEDDASVPTDLATLVTALQETQRLTEIDTPPSPWLPPLPDIVTLDDMELPEPSRNGVVPPIPFGMADVPSEQSREVATLDLSSGGHLAVVGAPRSGRSSALRAVAGAVGRLVDPRDVHVYGFDCGNNALLPLVSLPHTGAVVSREQTDRLTRLTARLQAEIAQRQQSLAMKGFSDIREQRAASPPEERLPYLLVLLDRWEGFVAAYDMVDSGRLIDAWMQILQEGAGVGVKVVATVDRTGLMGRVSTLFEDKLVLRLTDPQDVTVIGLPKKEVPEHYPPGRGFRAAGLRETQVALLTEDDDGTAQVAELQRIAQHAPALHDIEPARRPFRVDPLPASITVADALELAETRLQKTEFLVGVGGDTLGVRAFDGYEHGPALLVTGPPRSGRSTTLMTIIRSMVSQKWRVVVIVPRRSPLRDLTGTRGVTAVYGADADPEEMRKAVTSLPAPNALVIDDLELLGQDGGLVDLINERVRRVRDTGNLVVAAGTTDELASMYRGPVVAIKKNRAGVLLNPLSHTDGEIFGLRLPRSTAGGMPVGRGFMVRTGRHESIQVAADLDSPNPRAVPRE